TITQETTAIPDRLALLFMEKVLQGPEFTSWESRGECYVRAVVLHTDVPHSYQLQYHGPRRSSTSRHGPQCHRLCAPFKLGKQDVALRRPVVEAYMCNHQVTALLRERLHAQDCFVFAGSVSSIRRIGNRPSIR